MLDAERCLFEIDRSKLQAMMPDNDKHSDLTYRLMWVVAFLVGMIGQQLMRMLG